MPEQHPFWGGNLVNKTEYRGTIKNWYKYYDDTWNGAYIIWGDLYTPDGKERLSDRYGFHTSAVKHMADDESECETLNSKYRLEDKREEKTTT